LTPLRDGQRFAALIESTTYPIALIPDTRATGYYVLEKHRIRNAFPLPGTYFIMKFPVDPA
jgi:hypothetical protein